jgi:hypothetical protein
MINFETEDDEKRIAFLLEVNTILSLVLAIVDRERQRGRDHLAYIVKKYDLDKPATPTQPDQVRLLHSR